jgi:acyl carrier protein
MDLTDLTDRIRSVIATVLEADDDEIIEGASFRDDFGADSIRAMEIAARLERLLGVEIPSSELPKMTDLGAVRDTLVPLLA